jgi:hypothetical protein
VFQPAGGSRMEITARVLSVDNTDGWAKCGLMFRSNLDPGSPHVFMALTPGNGAAFQNRMIQNATSLNDNRGAIHIPYWVRISSDGNKYIGYFSPDGINWNVVDSLILALGNHPYVGLAYTAHNNAVSGTAVIDHVSVDLHQDSLFVRLTDFTGTNVNNQYSQLNWTTGQELNFDHFEIEHSTSTTNFIPIGTVAGNGDSQFAQDYAFQDPNPSEGANYYRLKMVDKQGNFSYSHSVLVNFSLAIIQLYPNPAKRLVYLKNNVNFTNNEPIQVELINPLGQRLFKEAISTAGLNLMTVQFPSGFPSGTYFFIAVNSKGQKQTWKLQFRN